MDEQAFLDKIFDSPGVEENYLVYADWLEEQGETDRAQLIRVQIQHNQTPHEDNRLRGYRAQSDRPTVNELRTQIEQLQKTWQKTWPFSAALKKKLRFGWQNGLPAFLVLNVGTKLTSDDLETLAQFPYFYSMAGLTHLPPEQLEQLGQCSTLRRLGFHGITPEQVGALQKIPHLRSLTLEGEASLEALFGLEPLTRLQTLFLPDIDQPQAEAIGRLTNLEELEMENGFEQTGSLSDEGIAHLLALQKLKGLRIPSSQTTDAGCELISRFKHLRSLDLSYTKITDAGVAHLAPLKQLRELRLGGTKITDESMPTIGGFEKLEILDLSGNDDLTDTSIGHLEKLKDLRVLEVAWSGFTRLRMAQVLPKLKKLKKLYVSAGMEISGAYESYEIREVAAFLESFDDRDMFVDIHWE